MEVLHNENPENFSQIQDRHKDIEKGIENFLGIPVTMEEQHLQTFMDAMLAKVKLSFTSQ